MRLRHFGYDWIQYTTMQLRRDWLGYDAFASTYGLRYVRHVVYAAATRGLRGCNTGSTRIRHFAYAATTRCLHSYDSVPKQLRLGVYTVTTRCLRGYDAVSMGL